MAFDLATVDAIFRSVYIPAVREQLTATPLLTRLLGGTEWKVVGSIHDSLLLEEVRGPWVWMDFDDSSDDTL